MLESTIQQTIWNRACGSGPAAPGAGDTALASMLTFHGLVMNVGAVHAIACLTAEQVALARSGYRHFGFGNIAGVIGAGQQAIGQGLDMDVLEVTLDEAYAAIIENDAVLMQAFEADYARQPGAYAGV